MGFQITNKADQIRWMKYVAFQNGISPREYDRIAWRDVMDIMRINTAIAEKQMSEAEVQKMMRGMRW